jgi:hypothetical protein
MTTTKKIWALQFTVAGLAEDEERGDTDDIEGQLRTVGQLCQKRGVRCCEEWADGQCRLLLVDESVAEQTLDDLIIEAARLCCGVTAVQVERRILNDIV